MSLLTHGSDVFLNNFGISLKFFVSFQKVDSPIPNIVKVVSQPYHGRIVNKIFFTSVYSAELLILHVFPDFSETINVF